MSDHRGIQDQDPVERLAAALRRIAVGIERREASAAAMQGRLDRTIEGAPSAVTANLDALIARLRSVLDSAQRPDGGS